MRKIREVLRLHSLGLTQRQIALSCSTGQSTVSEYLKAAEAAGLQWPDIAEWDEARLEAALLPRRPAEPQRGPQPEPDFAAMHAELQRDRHVTLQLLWEEYRAVHPDGYGYSRYCELTPGTRARPSTNSRKTAHASLFDAQDLARCDGVQCPQCGGHQALQVGQPVGGSAQNGYRNSAAASKTPFFKPASLA
jgi:hypothetical protein